jgi:metal-responsive CopG/Arc/MetJ family transcriptional regulator
MRKKVLTKQVGVLFSEQIYKKLAAMTELKEVSLSEFIRQIVQQDLNSTEKGDITNE